MDTLIRSLPLEEPTHPEDDESPLIFPTQIVVPAQHYQFELLAWHQKEGQWHFDIRTVPTSEEYEEARLFFPFWALSWLRKQIVTILAEHDEGERIKEMPKIPEWATRAVPKIEQQKKQPNVEQEQVTDFEKNADDADEDCLCCTKEEKCWIHFNKPSGLTNRRPVQGKPKANAATAHPNDAHRKYKILIAAILLILLIFVNILVFCIILN